MNVQIVGAVLGILGSYLVTSKKSDTRCIAFFIWILSNILIGMVYIKFQQWPLLAMALAYLTTSIIGLWRNRPDFRNEA